MRWLTTRPDAIPTALTPRDVLAAVPSFQQQKKELTTAWAGELPWQQLLKLAIRVARKTL